MAKDDEPKDDDLLWCHLNGRLGHRSVTWSRDQAPTPPIASSPNTSEEPSPATSAMKSLLERLPGPNQQKPSDLN